MVEKLDINNDGLVDKKDIKKLNLVLDNMKEEDFLDFVKNIDSLLKKEGLYDKIKNILEKDFNINEEKTSNLYKLYKKIYIKEENNSKISLLDKKQIEELQKEGISNEEILNILDKIPEQDIKKYKENIKYNDQDFLEIFILNYKKYSDKLDLNTIFYLSNFILNDKVLDDIPYPIKYITDKKIFVDDDIISKISLLKEFIKEKSYEDIKLIFENIPKEDIEKFLYEDEQLFWNIINNFGENYNNLKNLDLNIDLDINNIFYLSNFYINKETFKDKGIIEIIQKAKGFIKEKIFITDDIMDIIENNILQNNDIDNIIKYAKLGKMDTNSYFELLDMNKTPKYIEELIDKHYEEYSILYDKGLYLDNIVYLIENNFPIKKYKDYISKDNSLLVTQLYSRWKLGNNDIENEKKFEELLYIENKLSNIGYNINLNNLEELVYYNDFYEVVDDLSDLYKEDKELYDSLKNTLGDEFYILRTFISYYYYLSDDKFKTLKDYFKKVISMKKNNMEYWDIIDCFENNKNCEKKQGKEGKENTQEENKTIFDKLEEKNINIELFNKYIGKILNLKIEKGKNLGTEKENYISDIISLEGFNDMLKFIDSGKNTKINILGTIIDIKENIQIMTDILKYRKLNNELNISFDKLIKKYNDDLSEFLSTPYNENNVLVTFQVDKFTGGDNEGAFTGEKGLLRRIFDKSDFIDLSVNGIDKKKNIKDIEKELEEILKDNPNKDIIFYIGVHGDKDGSASFEGGKINKIFFENINKLANKYSNFKVRVDSCYSGYKLSEQKIQGNIFLTSGKEVSTSSITGILNNGLDKTKIDIDKNGSISFKELVFYEMRTYKDSLLQFNNFHSFVKNKGKIRKLPSL